MAENIRYDMPPPPPPRPTARDEWEDLLETLHRSGTLRVLKGAVGQFPGVAEVVLDQANSPTGQNILGSLAVLGDLAGSIPAEDLQPVAQSAQEGIMRAHKTLRDEDAPSTLQVLSLLHDKDTRRALAAVLQVFKAVGEQMPERASEQESS